MLRSICVMFCSLISALTCILSWSGRRTKTWFSRTVAPSSITQSFPLLDDSLAKTTCPETPLGTTILQRPIISLMSLIFLSSTFRDFCWLVRSTSAARMSALSRVSSFFLVTFISTRFFDSANVNRLVAFLIAISAFLTANLSALNCLLVIKPLLCSFSL